MCSLPYIYTVVIRFNKVRRMAHVVCVGAMGNSYGIPIWEPEGKVKLRRKFRWEDGVKVYLKEFIIIIIIMFLKG